MYVVQQMYICMSMIFAAFNKIGSGEPSSSVKVTTKGSRPLVPVGSSTFLEANAISIKINLSPWDPDPDCPVTLFIVDYKVKGSSSSWMTGMSCYISFN